MIIKEAFFDVEDMINEIVNSEYFDNFYIIGKYDEMTEVVKRLIVDADLTPIHIFLSDYNWDHYDGEFIVSHFGDELYCEKAKNGSKYLNFDAGVIFALPSCSDECIECLKYNYDGYAVVFKVDFLVNEDNDNALSEDITDGAYKSNNIYTGGDGHTFVKTWSETKNGITSQSTFSFYCDDINETKRIAKFFDVELG